MSYYVLSAIAVIFFILIFYNIFKQEKQNDKYVNDENLNTHKEHTENLSINNSNALSNCKSDIYPKNKIAKSMKLVSIILLILGIIIGITQLDTYLVLGITYIVISIISSIFVYGFGEIIQLLEDIKNK